MANPLIQQIAEGLGLTQPVNGSWIQAIADFYGITTPTNGSWEQAIAEELGATEPANGSWIQAIAEAVGLTQTENGTWLYAINENGLGPNFPVPTNLTNIAQGYTTLDYSWTAGGDETSWEVEYGLAGVGGSFYTANTASYQLTSLNPNTLYEARVRAIISAGTFSNYTAPVVAETNTIGVPANLAASGETSSSFVAYWDAVADADSYDIEIDGIGTFSSTTNSYTATTLSAETTYDFRARADVDGFKGAWTDYEQVTTAIPNTYSMQFNGTSTVANIERLYINNQSNAIDTALRDTTPNFSVSFWFKRTVLNERGVIFSKYDNYISYDKCFVIWFSGGDNRMKFFGQYDQNNSSLDLATQNIFSSTSVWTHVVFVYDNTQTTASEIAKVYLNGVEYTNWATQSVNTTQKYFNNQTTESNRAWVTIGCMYGGASPRVASDGASMIMDDFTFWDKSLSQSEAEELYNSGNPKDVSTMTSYSANCLAWYRMGDASGDTFSTNWTIQNVKGTASTDLTSANLTSGDRVTDVY